MRKWCVLLLLAISVPAFAAKTEVERRYTKAYDDCMTSGDAAKGITSAMRECNSLEVERQDGRLNQAYVMVMKRLGALAKAKLRTSQRAWIKSRDQICEVERREYEGGTFAPIAYMGCLTNQTIKRTIWLERYR